jgi:lipopolysaccharide/colanic/teichoic acid biosynthesis glycosyltransferase
MTTINSSPARLTSIQAFQKRGFDLIISTLGLLLSWWIIFLAWCAACLDTRSNGFFIQKRVGRYGRLFSVVKIRTMRPCRVIRTTVTISDDPRITPLGCFFRRTKIDELPQLWNVFMGHMSFVGPRPDVSGFADMLQGEERALLSIRPGITGPATLKYRNEEELLAAQHDAERYNKEVIWPDKVEINLNYMRNWSLSRDVQYIIKTVFH